MASHAKFSASSSERWLACSGSIQLIEKLPPSDNGSSSYAEEGTKAHECLEVLLKNKKNYEKAAKMLLKSHPADMVQYALDAFKEIMKRAEGCDLLLAETRVDLSFIEPNMFGTADAVIVNEFGRLQVIDFKYGAGIVVDPEENSQLIYYALGVAHKFHYNFSDVEIVIIQPRAEFLDDEGNPKTTRSWVTSIDNLKAWRNTFALGVAKCKSENPPLAAGSHCRFCPAAAICPEISDNALKQAQVDFAPQTGDTDVKSLPQMFELNLPAVLKAIPLIEGWIEEVKSYAFGKLQSGVEIEGYKLVEKRGTRKWANPDAAKAQAIEAFGAEALTEPELKSPAQLEKIKGAKAWVSERCTTVSSGLTMVPDSDARQAINPIAIDFAEPLVSEDEWKKPKKKNK